MPEDASPATEMTRKLTATEKRVCNDAFESYQAYVIACAIVNDGDVEPWSLEQFVCWMGQYDLLFASESISDRQLDDAAVLTAAGVNPCWDDEQFKTHFIAPRWKRKRSRRG